MDRNGMGNGDSNSKSTECGGTAGGSSHPWWRKRVVIKYSSFFIIFFYFMFTEIPFEDDGDRKLQKATIRKKEEGKRQQDYGIREEREESRTEVQNGTKFC